jgi:hypothetical protein
MVSEGDSFDSSTRREFGGVDAHLLNDLGGSGRQEEDLTRINMDQQLRPSQKLRSAGSLLKAEFQKDGEDERLKAVGGTAAELAPGEGTEGLDSPVQEVPQGRRLEIALGSAQSSRDEDELQVERSEIVGGDKNRRVRESSEGLSLSGLKELGKRNAPESVAVETYLRKLVSGDKPYEKDKGAERLGKLTLGKESQKEEVSGEASSIGGGEKAADEDEMVEVESRLEAPATIRIDRKEESLDGSREIVWKQGLPEHKGIAEIQEKEVRRFFADYIERYNSKHVDDFLSLFSYKALQNGKDEFNEIKDIYSRFFDQSRQLRCRLTDLRIKIHKKPMIYGRFSVNSSLIENPVEAKARYAIDQISRKGGKRRVWRGSISWLLLKEDETLKILFLDYEPE